MYFVFGLRAINYNESFTSSNKLIFISYLLHTSVRFLKNALDIRRFIDFYIKITFIIFCDMVLAEEIVYKAILIIMKFIVLLKLPFICCKTKLKNAC